MSEYVIETKNLTKHDEQKSVTGVNLHVRPGRIYGLLGRDDSGKTTVMRMLLGLTNPTGGDVFLFGKNIRTNGAEVLPRVGGLLEPPSFYPNLTGTENLNIFAQLRGGPKSDAVVAKALEAVELPYRDQKPYAQYSLAMKRRLDIALALMHDPELLIFNAPIDYLDAASLAEIRNFIRKLCDERGKTILVSSHIPAEMALLADDIGIIDRGVLLEEASLAELEQKCQKCIYFELSDPAQAARILEENFQTNNFKVLDDRRLALDDVSLPVARINQAFVEAGIDLYASYLSETTLDDYFKKVTIGENIA